MLIISYLIFSLGVLNIFKLYKTFFKKLDTSYQKSNLVELVIYLVVILFFLSAAPVTSADSLDYHLHIGKEIAKNGIIPLSLNHFHSHLFGSGEILISIGILSGSEQLNSIIQFSGLMSILGIIRFNNKYKNEYSIYLLSSPIIIFFLSSIKPQFLYRINNICFYTFLFTGLTII